MTEVAIVDLTTEQAKDLTEQIRARVVEIWPLIVHAYEGRAWLPLGHASWNAYCDAELRGIRPALGRGERQERIGELRQAGMSTRAIGAALGVAQETVRRDLASTDSNESVGTVTGLDGKERPARAQARAPRPLQPADEDREPTTAELPPVECENCGKPVAPDEAAVGYQRCDDCDPDGDHFADELPDGGRGACRHCHPESAGDYSKSPQGIADQIAAENRDPIIEPQWSDEEDALLEQMQAGKTVVVSMRGGRHANLIAWADSQGRYARIDRRSEWGNPFEMPGDGDRETVIRNYALHYLPHKPAMLTKVNDLRGNALGCWCAPEPCHGDVLLGLAESDGDQAPTVDEALQAIIRHAEELPASEFITLIRRTPEPC